MYNRLEQETHEHMLNRCDEMETEILLGKRVKKIPNDGWTLER